MLSVRPAQLSLRNKLKFGKAGTRHWLHSQPARVSSATVRLENDKGQVLVVKANYKQHWSFPGGIIEAGETPREAAIRETLEEVGIDIPAEQLEFVAVVTRSSSIATTYQFVFKAPLLTDQVDKIILQAAEIEAYDLVTREQVTKNEEMRQYGEVVEHWVNGRTGYFEQILNL